MPEEQKKPETAITVKPEVSELKTADYKKSATNQDASEVNTADPKAPATKATPEVIKANPTELNIFFTLTLTLTALLVVAFGDAPPITINYFRDLLAPLLTGAALGIRYYNTTRPIPDPVPSTCGYKFFSLFGKSTPRSALREIEMKPVDDIIIAEEMKMPAGAVLTPQTSLNTNR